MKQVLFLFAITRILFGVLAFVLLWPSLCHGLDKIRVGLSSISATLGSIWVAEEKGLFKKHGLEPEVVVIGGGGARSVSSLIAGDIQFVTGGGDAGIRASLRGVDVVLVGSGLNKGLQRVLARPGLRGPEDLKGKRVGVTRFGSASHLVLQLVLRKWALRPEEVQVLQVESSPAMLASLDRGGLDAAVMTMPSFFVAEEKGYRVLADVGDMDIHYPQGTILTTRSYLRTQRHQSIRFMKGLIEGVAYFKKQRQESLKVLAKKLRIQSDQERDIKYLEMSYDLLNSKYYDRIPYVSFKGVETVLEFLSKEDPKAKGSDPRSFVDHSILRSLEESGFIRKLYE